MKISQVKTVMEKTGFEISRLSNNSFEITNLSDQTKQILTRSKTIKLATELALHNQIDVAMVAPAAKKEKKKRKAVKATAPSMAASSVKKRHSRFHENGESTIQTVQDVINEQEIDYDISIPKTLDGFYFDPIAKPIMARVKRGVNIHLSGSSGTGKSQLVAHLAKLLNQKLLRVNFSVGTTEQHLIGRWAVKNGETVFNYGVLPLAMKNGWWILFDEMDYAMPEHLAILQPVLEGENLLMTQHENEEIIPHPNFRIFATGNTKGRGDANQSYVGTSVMNLAFLDRWAIFEMDYTKKEPEIVMNIVNDEKLTESIMKFFGLLRDASADGTILNSVFSTRRLISLAEALIFGDTLKEALEYEVFVRYDKHEVSIMKEYAYDVWEREHYLKTWRLGDAHFVEPPSLESTDPAAQTEPAAPSS